MLNAATHKQTGAADHAANRCAGAELSGIHCTSRGEPQALDGGAVLFGGTMKRAVVKRRRMRGEHTIHEAQAEGGFIAFGALCVLLH